MSGAAKTMALLTPASAMRSLSRFWSWTSEILLPKMQDDLRDEEDDAEQRGVHRHDDEDECVRDHASATARSSDTFWREGRRQVADSRGVAAEPDAVGEDADAAGDQLGARSRRRGGPRSAPARCRWSGERRAADVRLHGAQGAAVEAAQALGRRWCRRRP